jgi:hypothetical protein
VTIISEYAAEQARLALSTMQRSLASAEEALDKAIDGNPRNPEWRLGDWDDFQTHVADAADEATLIANLTPSQVTA